MLTLTPDTTIPQPVRALGIANTRRSAAAVLKTRLRRREITLREILEHPPAELERQMTWEVLLWAPGIGRTRLRALNVACDPRGARQPRRPARRAHRTPAQLARRPPMPMNDSDSDRWAGRRARARSGQPARSPATTAASTPARRTTAPTRSRSSRCCSDDPSSPTDTRRQTSWSCPLAGGQRTITLDPVPGRPPTAV